MRAFSAIRLLFCSFALATAAWAAAICELVEFEELGFAAAAWACWAAATALLAATAAATAAASLFAELACEAAAKSGWLRNNMAAIEGSIRCEGGPGGGPKPIIPMGGPIMPIPGPPGPMP